MIFEPGYRWNPLYSDDSREKPPKTSQFSPDLSKPRCSWDSLDPLRPLRSVCVADDGSGGGTLIVFVYLFYSGQASSDLNHTKEKAPFDVIVARRIASLLYAFVGVLLYSC